MAPPTRQPRLNDLLKAEADISAIKKLLALVAGAAFGCIFSIGVWLGNTENKIQVIENVVHELETRQRSADILAAKIETRLLSIEANILEIKRAVQ